MTRTIRILGFLMLGACLPMGVLLAVALADPSGMARLPEGLTAVLDLFVTLHGTLASLGFALAILAIVYVVRADRAERPGLFGSMLLLASPALLFVVYFWVFEGPGLVGRAREAELAALTVRAEPLIAAIRRYEEDHGRPPVSLQALVPDYVRAVPGTGYSTYPEFEYESFADRRPPAEGVPWELRVFTPRGFLDFDFMFYWPGEDYPEGWPIDPIGSWAYLNE